MKAHSSIRNVVCVNGLSAAAVASATVLARLHPTALVASGLALTSYLVSRYLLTRSHRTLLQWGGLLKIIAVLPLGLCAVVAYGLAPMHWRQRNLWWFNVYINAAVFGNIAGMLFVPAGGTMRGRTTRIACASLVVWLVKEASSQGWQTVRYNDDGAFLFTAAPLTWIVCHALYRAVLVTLPSFESVRYIIMEPASLATMASMHWAWSAGHEHTGGSPINMGAYFGYADTLVVACMSATSKLIDETSAPATKTAAATSAASSKQSFWIRDRALDAVGVAVHIFVCCVSVWNIVM
eukprot:Opistho-2@2720